MSRDLTPHPQYAAFYKWLQQDYKADAVVHFGMHGTVEWLPGAPLGQPLFMVVGFVVIGGASCRCLRVSEHLSAF